MFMRYGHQPRERYEVLLADCCGVCTTSSLPSEQPASRRRRARRWRAGAAGVVEEQGHGGAGVEQGRRCHGKERGDERKKKSGGHIEGVNSGVF
jgi:hypothetical protein